MDQKRIEPASDHVSESDESDGKDEIKTNTTLQTKEDTSFHFNPHQNVRVTLYPKKLFLI